MVVERRYSVGERNRADKVKVATLYWPQDQLLPGQVDIFPQTELVDCANRLGAEMLGLQAELDKSACNNEVSLTRLVHSWTETSLRS